MLFILKDIPAIHQMYAEGKSQTEIAKRYKSSQGTIGAILRGETYTHWQPANRATLRKKGFPSGCDNKRSKVDRDAVLRIRSLSEQDMSIAAIVRETGLNREVVRGIVRNRTYRDVL